LLILRCSPRRNSAHATLTLGVSHKQHHVTFRHADDDKPIFAIVLAIIEALDGKRSLNTVLAKSKLTP